jgi:AhpC/TSA family
MELSIVHRALRLDKKNASAEIAVRCLGGIAMLALSGVVGAQTVRYGVDLKGAPVTGLAAPGKRAVVLFFAASDCPISNRYLPEMARLQHEFAERGVEFWQVYPNPGDTAAVVRQHSIQFGDSAKTVLDTEQVLVGMAHVTVTPEAAVFIRAGDGLREVYHGRIDDRYLDLGSERPRALRHDLEDAIASALENKPVPQPGGPPVGCAIVTRQP